MAIRALVRTRITNHWGNTAVVAFLSESVGGSGTNCHTSWVRFVVSVKIWSICRIGIIIRFAACTVINVSHTCYTKRIAVSTVRLISRVAYTDLYIEFILSHRTVTLTYKGIGPLVVLVCAQSAVSVRGTKAFHATLITKSAEISLTPIIICRIRPRRFVVTAIIILCCVILISIECSCVYGSILSKKLIDGISW